MGQEEIQYKCPSCKKQHEIKPTYKCTSCGKTYAKQSGNFAFSQSPFYQANNGYITVCKHCLDYYENEYTEALGNNEKAVERLCLHFDLYAGKDLLNSATKSSKKQNKLVACGSKLNLQQYKGKTYDTYMYEVAKEKGNAIETVHEVDSLPEETSITKDTVMFWGLGYQPEEYSYLDGKYKEWVSGHECNTKSQESIFQKICLLELQITRAAQSGEKVESMVRAYNDLLGSANVKPVQNNDNVLAERNTFGTLIKKWENEKPIPEPEPEWQDVDGIKKYITVWFLGHLCKMMGIKNEYSRQYEEEVARYSVDIPQYEEEEETPFDEIFGGGNNDSDT